MYKIFVGILLIILEFNLNIDYMSIGLLPDFIGFYLISRGMWEMEDEATYFRGTVKTAKSMAVYALVIYILQVLGVYNYLLFEINGIVSLLISLANTLIFMYITYAIMAGVQEMEEYFQEDMKGNALESSWKFMVVMEIITSLCSVVILFLPNLLADVYLMAVLLAFLSMVVYAVNLFIGARRYERHP